MWAHKGLSQPLLRSTRSRKDSGQLQGAVPPLVLMSTVSPPLCGTLWGLGCLPSPGVAAVFPPPLSSPLSQRIPNFLHSRTTWGSLKKILLFRCTQNKLNQNVQGVEVRCQYF